MKRATTPALACLAMLVLACGGRDRPGSDLVGVLMQAVQDRDVESYQRVLTRADEAHPLPDATLERLVDLLVGEMSDGLAWPAEAFPSATVIVRGAEEPVRWIALARARRYEAMGRPWGIDTPPGTAPRLALGAESLPELRRRLTGDGTTHEAWEAAHLAGSLEPALLEKLAPDLVAAMGTRNGGIALQCRYALRNLDAVAVPYVAEGIRTGTSTLRMHAAWMLCFMPDVSTPAVPALRIALGDQWWLARLYAANALIKRDRTDVQAQEALRDLVVDGAASTDDPTWAGKVYQDIVNWHELVELLPLLRRTLDSRILSMEQRAALRSVMDGLAKTGR